MRAGIAKIKSGSLEYRMDRGKMIFIYFHRRRSGTCYASLFTAERKGKPEFHRSLPDLESARIAARVASNIYLSKEETMSDVVALHEYEDFLILRIEWEDRDSPEYFTEYYIISSDDTAKNMAMLFRHVDGNIVYKLGRKKGVQCRSIEEGDKIVDEYLQSLVVDAALNGGKING